MECDTININNKGMVITEENRKKDNEKIGIIATSGTIRSGAWEKKIRDNISDVCVINEEAPLLATMAEQGWINNKVAKYTIKEYMKCFKNVDRLILGCTHYPLFEELIKKELKRKTEIINTGVKLAEHLKKYLQEKELESDSKMKDYTIFLTDINPNFKTNAEKLLGEGLKEKIKKADI